MRHKIIIRQRLPEGRWSLADYRQFISEEEYWKIVTAVNKLKNKKIVYLNSTAAGGGVAELLKNMVPLLRSIGLSVDWYVMAENKKFFSISKKLHNTLQGSKEKLTASEKKFYLNYGKKIATEINSINPDVLMLQDPQPLACVQDLLPSIRKTCRIHIDMTHPNPDSLRLVQNLINQYDQAVFTLKNYVPRGIQTPVLISPPGIDPLAEKNKPLSDSQIEAVAERLNLNRAYPFLVQVSRFDIWKDPMGVIQTYRLIKKEFPQVQLLLMGVIEADDDPEQEAVYENVKKYAADDPNIFLIRSKRQLQGIRLDTFVNAVQRLADVVLQKSLKEGFGLTVSEALWKGKAVVAGDVGGIKVQIKNGTSGFLVKSPKEAAKMCTKLFRDRGLARSLGRTGRKTVLEKFLLIRYVADELKVMLG